MNYLSEKAPENTMYIFLLEVSEMRVFKNSEYVNFSCLKNSDTFCFSIVSHFLGVMFFITLDYHNIKQIFQCDK